MASVMRKINMIFRASGVFRSDKLKDLDLRPSQHSYVFAISRNPGITQDVLASKICTNKSTVTRQVSNLEKSGYVIRKTNESDRRAVCLYPTQKMLDALPFVRSAVKEWNEYLFEDITDVELEKFNIVLDKLVVRAKKYVDEGEGEL